MCAARAATEGALAAALHLDGPADCSDELTRRRLHVVVTGEIARVVIRDLVVARNRREPARRARARPASSVWCDDLVVAPEIGILVREGVEAVRAAGDDLRHACVVERRHVLLGERLEDVLVAHPPGGIAGTRLPRSENGEVHPRCLEQLRRRRRRRPCTLVEGRRAPDPVEDLGRRIARLEDPHPEPFGPVGAIDLRLAPRVAPALDIAKHRSGFGGKARLDHHQLPAQIDDVIHVLDLHRALLDAGAAGDAVPDHLLRNAPTDDRRELPAGERERALPRTAGRGRP